MNVLKQSIALLLVLALCLSLGLCAFAQEGAAEDLPVEAEGSTAEEDALPVEGTALLSEEETPPVEADGASAERTLAERLSLSYTGMSWDEIVQRLLEAHRVQYGVALGYLNLVSGEEHYFNGDDYMTTGSMFKLPLCMYFTEHLRLGDLSWTHDTPYESIRDDVLIDSSNEKAMLLADQLGGYGAFRRATAEYTGVPYEEEPLQALTVNLYTARELISVLRTLYTGRERFPEIIETMQKALPDRFFKLHEQRFDIGHKAGWLTDDDVAVRNDCGLAFTREPIALVAFTRGVPSAEEFLTDYCTAMCEYAEANAAPPPTPEPTPAPTAAPAPAVSVVEEQPLTLSPLPFVFVALFLLFGIVTVFVFGVKYRARVLTLLLAVLLSAAAMGMSVVGVQLGTVYARPSGDPAATADEFLSAICRGDYGSAYRHLRDYSDLGLGIEPSTAAGQMVSKALHESYAYTLTGPCSVSKLDAVQPLRFRYLDLPALEQAAAEETPRQLERIVEHRTLHEIYDENNRYLPAVTEEAYLAALDIVLQQAEAYYAEVDLELLLSYTDGRWQILTSPAFLRALNGGTAY